MTRREELEVELAEAEEVLEEAEDARCNAKFVYEDALDEEADAESEVDRIQSKLDNLKEGE